MYAHNDFLMNKSCILAERYLKIKQIFLFSNKKYTNVSENIIRRGSFKKHNDTNL